MYMYIYIERERERTARPRQPPGPARSAWPGRLGPGGFPCPRGSFCFEGNLRWCGAGRPGGLSHTGL